MNVSEAVQKKEGIPVDITEEPVRDLAEITDPAPSCFNNQPWRFVFVYDKEMLLRMHEALADVGDRVQRPVSYFPLEHTIIDFPLLKNSDWIRE